MPKSQRARSPVRSVGKLGSFEVGFLLRRLRHQATAAPQNSGCTRAPLIYATSLGGCCVSIGTTGSHSSGNPFTKLDGEHHRKLVALHVNASLGLRIRGYAGQCYLHEKAGSPGTRRPGPGFSRSQPSRGLTEPFVFLEWPVHETLAIAQRRFARCRAR
jgi:hypothetical protein